MPDSVTFVVLHSFLDTDNKVIQKKFIFPTSSINNESLECKNIVVLITFSLVIAMQ